jgi:hypothetical protein
MVAKCECIDDSASRIERGELNREVVNHSSSSVACGLVEEGSAGEEAQRE